MTLTYLSGSSQNTGEVTLDVPAPSGLSAGNLLIAFACSEVGFGVTPPSGWTSSGVATDDFDDQLMAVFWKVAGYDEPGAYTWEMESSDQRNSVVILQYSVGATDGDSTNATTSDDDETAWTTDAFDVESGSSSDTVIVGVAVEGPPDTPAPADGMTARDGTDYLSTFEINPGSPNVPSYTGDISDGEGTWGAIAIAMKGSTSSQITMIV